MKNGKTEAKIHIRKALNSDREAVLSFCRKTWRWGDYIQHVWNDWLTQKNGRLFTATAEAQPVGIMHVSIDKSRDAWLRGARTDPEYRRMGIATALTNKCLEYAKRKGAKVARLATQSDNEAAQAVLGKLGFEKVAEFTDPKTEDITEEESRNTEWAEENKVEEIWSYVQSSETYRETAGLYTILYQYFTLKKEDLARLVMEKKAIIHKNAKGKVDGLVLIDDAPAREWHRRVLQTSYVDGNCKAIVEAFKFLKTHCHKNKIRKIYVFAANNKRTISAFKKLEFELPDSTDLVYEKKL